MSTEHPDNSETKPVSIEEAAEAGPVPGAVEADEAARRGEDDSEVVDPEAKSERDGAETVPGGINMR